MNKQIQEWKAGWLKRLGWSLSQWLNHTLTKCCLESDCKPFLNFLSSSCIPSSDLKSYIFEIMIKNIHLQICEKDHNDYLMIISVMCYTYQYIEISIFSFNIMIQYWLLGVSIHWTRVDSLVNLYYQYYYCLF